MSNDKSTDNDNEYVKIRVIHQDDFLQLYRLRKTAMMKKMMMSFAKQKNVRLSSLRFLYDGRRIKVRDTAESLGLEEDDQIDVYGDQVAGNIH